MSPSTPIQSSPSYLLGRASGALAIFSVLLGSTAPSPLYPIYIEQMDLSHAMGTAVFAIYAIGTLCSLALTARIGTRIGDLRRLIVPGLIITALGATVFATADGLTMLLVGRFLNGFGTGVVTGMASVALYNLAPAKGKAMAATLATLAFTGGAAGGPLLSSAALALDLAPTLFPFLVIIAVVLLACAGLAVCSWPESAKRSAKTEESSSRAIENESETTGRSTSWPLYGLACFALATAWMLGSVFMAVGADFGARIYDFRDAGLAGLIPALFQLLAGAGQAVWGRIHPARAIAWGLAGMLLAQIALFLAALGADSLTVLALISCSGFSYGATFVGALGLASLSAAPDQRERLISGFYIVGYLSNAIPSFVMGILIDRIGTEPAFETFSVAMAVATSCGVGLALLLRDKSSATD